MTAQVPTSAARAATGASVLAVHSAGHTHTFEAECSGVVLRGGELRILDRAKQITAVYLAGTWTILPLGHRPAR